MHSYRIYAYIEKTYENTAHVCWPANKKASYTYDTLRYVLPVRFIKEYYYIISGFNSEEESVAYIYAMEKLSGFNFIRAF